MAGSLPVKSPIYTYARLVKQSTSYAKRMNRLSNRIFTEVVRPTSEPSMKVVHKLAAQPLDLRQDVINHYPRHIETYNLMMLLRSYGLYRDEHQDFQEEMERLKALRGKGRKAKQEKKKMQK